MCRQESSGGDALDRDRGKPAKSRSFGAVRCFVDAVIGETAMRCERYEHVGVTVRLLYVRCWKSEVRGEAEMWFGCGGWNGMEWQWSAGAAVKRVGPWDRGAEGPRDRRWDRTHREAVIQSEAHAHHVPHCYAATFLSGSVAGDSWVALSNRLLVAMQTATAKSKRTRAE